MMIIVLGNLDARSPVSYGDALFARTSIIQSFTELLDCQYNILVFSVPSFAGLLAGGCHFRLVDAVP